MLAPSLEAFGPRRVLPSLIISRTCRCGALAWPLSLSASCRPLLRSGCAFLRPLSQSRAVLSPFPATPTGQLQLAENTTTLSPVVATLTGRVTHNPFVCHSYKKHPGWGYPLQSKFFFCLSGTANPGCLPLAFPSHVLDTLRSHGTNALLARLHRCRGKIHA